MKHQDTRGYIIGFVASLGLTFVAYSLARWGGWSKGATMIALAVLALTQFFVQLTFFLHIKAETKPRWKLFVFGFMVLIVFILVAGSLWIMYNLDYNHVHPMSEPVDTYLKSQDGL